jgi:hypothetical protein
MFRKAVLTLLVGLVLASVVLAQTTPWRFRWQAGQVLTYGVEHNTSVAEVVGENKVTTTTKLTVVRRWQVLEVDTAGSATLQMSLPAMRYEMTTPGGETWVFDSAHPDKSTPQLREQLARYVGQPLAVLRIDRQGKLIEVKESKYDSASKYVNELPFKITLPDDGPKAGQTWERAHQIVLAPPLGVGEKYPAVQKYACKSADGKTATVTLTTAVSKLPEAVADQVPLLQFQPEGEVVFDLQAGLLRRAELRIDKELTGHQGEGSSYRFLSRYTEEYQGEK